MAKSQLYIKTDEALNFWNADAFCQFTYDTDLASIHNNIEHTQAVSTCSPSDYCWIGLNDLTSENAFTWTDGSLFDYGTNISKGVYPWNAGEPNNVDPDSGFGSDWGDQDCVHIQSVSAKWDDVWCVIETQALCKYPSPVYVLQDNADYQRSPSFSNLIAYIDVLDEVYVEFNIIIKSFQSGSKYTNIFHIGDEKTDVLPGIFIDDNNKTIYFAVQAIDGSGISTNAYYFVDSQAVEINKWYHIALHLQMNHLQINFNHSIIYDQDIKSHKTVSNQEMYLGSPWQPPSDVIISGLTVSTSNSNKLSSRQTFNYLCDWYNRFTAVSGTWSKNANACTVYKSNQDTANIAWLGSSDPSSLTWAAYGVETVFTVHSGDDPDAGLIIRTQSSTNSYYNVHIHVGHQKIVFARINEGTYQQLTDHYESSIDFGVEFRLRVIAAGDTFYIFFQNKWVFTYKDSVYSSGSIGLRNWNSAVTFTSLRIKFYTDNYLLTVNPSSAPTNLPSIPPSASSQSPSISPSEFPTVSPSSLTILPSQQPSRVPSHMPSTSPLTVPTNPPSSSPSTVPIQHSTNSLAPTHRPSSTRPTSSPTMTVYNDASTTVSKSGLGAKEKKANILVIILIVCAATLLLIMLGLVFLLYRKRKMIRQISQISDNIQIEGVSGSKIQAKEGEKDIIQLQMSHMDSIQNVKVVPMKNEQHNDLNIEYSSSSSDDSDLFERMPHKETAETQSGMDNASTAGTIRVPKNRTPNTSIDKKENNKENMNGNDNIYTNGDV